MKLLVVALVCLALPAHAEDRRAAERFFRAGEKAYRAQSYEAAAMNFEQAYKAYELPEIAFSAAQAYRRQYLIDGKPSHVARAIELYRKYIDKVRTGGRVTDASEAMLEMQHELEKLIKSGAKVSPELAADYTQLGVNVLLGDEKLGDMRAIEDAPAQKPDAHVEITIDGKPTEPSTPMKVAPGDHAVHVAAPGYFPVDRTEKMTQGEYQILDITLAPQPAKVAIATESGARISIDGRPVATGTSTVEMPAGKHLIAILRDGREPFAKELVVTRGTQIAVDGALHMTWKRRAFGRVAIAGAVTGALALGAGVLAIVEDTRASNLHDTFANPGDQPPTSGGDFNDDIKWRDRSLDATWALGGVTATLAVVAALLYYTDTPSLEGVHVEAAASPGGASAGVSVHF